MKKNKIILFGMGLSCLMLTECLEEILASLCNKLASNNSVIAVYPTSADRSNMYAKVTYQNVDTSQSLTLNECDGDFSFPNGERKTVTGSGSDAISFISILNQDNESFFVNGDVPNETDNFVVTISWFSGPCPAGGAQETFVDLGSSSADTLDFIDASGVEVPPLIGECSISGQTASVLVPVSSN
jgi:hypothetical protein